MEVERIKYAVHAAQVSEPNRVAKEEDQLLIIFKLFCVRVDQHARRSMLRGKTLIEEKEMWISLSDFKHPTNIYKYRYLISRCISTMSVPQIKNGEILRKVLLAVEAAETTQLPVVVHIWEAFCRIGPYTRINPPVVRKVIPAASSAIEGLESLVQVDASVIRQTPSCAICLEDFDLLNQKEQPMTKLPCRHHFHVHCIVQCLEFNHLCPLCRYEMPTQEADPV